MISRHVLQRWRSARNVRWHPSTPPTSRRDHCTLPSTRPLHWSQLLSTDNPFTAVICLLHGLSIGLAIDLSLCADIRICLPNTRFSVREIDIGLAADIGTLSRLPKAVSSFSWCKDVCLTARDFGAEEALRVGFVSEVVGWGAGGQTANAAGGMAGVGVGGAAGEVGQVAVGKEEGVKRALEIARVIAAKSPVAALGTKEILNYSRDRSVEDGECCV